VHFLGTQDDWDALPKKLAALGKYEGEGGDGSWAKYVEELVPVLDKLAATRRGDAAVDTAWWNGVIDEQHEKGYFAGGEAQLTGWALKFMYGVPRTVEDTSDLPDLFARVPIILDDHDVRTIKVKMLTGFSGLVVAEAEAGSTNGQVFRPHTSLAVIQERPEDAQIKAKPEGWHKPGNPENYVHKVAIVRDTTVPRAPHHTQLSDKKE
jgi:hypothetical protein